MHIAAEEVLSPASPHPRILVAFNAPSLEKFGPMVPEGGLVIYDSSVITEPPRDLAADVTVHPVPLTEIAVHLGNRVVKNIAALGALQEATQLFPAETFLTAIRLALADKCALVPLNEDAYAWGARAVREGITKFEEPAEA